MRKRICAYDARCERTSKFFNSVIVYLIRETGGRRQAKIMLNLKVNLKLILLQLQNLLVFAKKLLESSLKK